MNDTAHGCVSFVPLSYACTHILSCLMEIFESQPDAVTTSKHHASKIFVWLARGMSCVPLCNWYLTFCYVRFLSSSMQMCRFPSNSIQFWPYTAQSSQHSPNQTRKIVFSWLARLLPRARPILATLLMLSFFPISSLGSMHSSFRCRFSSSLCIEP